MQERKNLPQYIKHLYLKIDSVMKATFFTTMIVGAITHFYVFSNKFFNYFELRNIFSEMEIGKGDTLALGRWFLPTATNFFTTYSIPPVTGIVTLLYMGIAAALLVNMLGIKSKGYACLFASAWITFPGMACEYAFGVNADAACFSILLAVLAGFLLERTKWGVLWGSIALCFSLGIYQPFMSIAVGMVFLALLKNVFREEFHLKIFVKKVVKGIVMLALGFILYYLVLKLTLLVIGTTLSSYHGVDDMTSFSLKGLAKGLVYSYLYFFQYFFTTTYLYTWVRVAFNVVAAIIFLIVVIRLIVINNKKGNKLQNITLVIMIFFLPLGINSAPFLMGDRVGSGVDRYMLFSLMLLWAVLIMALDITKNRKLFHNENGNCVIQGASYLALIIAICSGYIICNQAYHRMETMTSTTNSICNRIVARIEVMPEWNKEVPIFYANCEEIVSEKFEVSIPEYEALEFMPGTGLFPYYSDIAISRYMEVYLHFPSLVPEEEIKQVILESQEFMKMPTYPAEGSIQMIGNTIVVKFNESESEE